MSSTNYWKISSIPTSPQNNRTSYVRKPPTYPGKMMKKTEKIRFLNQNKNIRVDRRALQLLYIMMISFWKEPQRLILRPFPPLVFRILSYLKSSPQICCREYVEALCVCTAGHQLLFYNKVKCFVRLRTNLFNFSSTLLKGTATDPTNKWNDDNNNLW